MRALSAFAALIAGAVLHLAAGPALAGQEITSYQGQALSPYHRSYDNSVGGPRELDREAYRLRVTGLVERPQALTYAQVLALPRQRRVELMPCVEGWSERLLYDGVLVTDVLALAGPKPRARWAVFHCDGGYSTALPLRYLRQAKAMLGFAVNGLPLDSVRGWPFQVVAPGKLGYKWAKWVVKIELTEEEVLGYWERRGYGNKADAGPPPPLLNE